jgi:hypothetical protein
LRIAPLIVTIAVVTTIAGAAGVAFAGPRDDVINDMIRCANMADTAARHACFDAAIPQLKAASQTAPVGETPPTPQVAAAEPQQESSGGWLSGLNPFGSGRSEPSQQQMAYQPLGAEILPLTIGVADYSTGPKGYTITLDNGQVWQNYPRLVKAPPFNPEEKNIVVIDRGMLGGYSLVVKGRGATVYKVVRIK